MPDQRAGRPCYKCGKPVEGNYRQITGWEKLRDKGGANRIIDRRETGQHACDEHGRMLEMGIDPDAPTLL